MQITITPSPDLRQSKKKHRRLKLAVSKTPVSGTGQAVHKSVPVNPLPAFSRRQKTLRHVGKKGQKPDLETLRKMQEQGEQLKKRLTIEIAGITIQLQRELTDAERTAGESLLNSLKAKQNQLEQNLKKLDAQIQALLTQP